ncbi:MAG TPA: alpha-L-arabinofuranosidase C-terminal domain-containing protein, partial [Blastocatellia bacterium]
MSNGNLATMRGLNGSASLNDRRVVLTVTNPDPKAARETEIAILGANIKEVNVMTLTAKDIHAHNSFENPRAIEPQTSQATLKGRTLVYSFAPASVTRLQITLA